MESLFCKLEEIERKGDKAALCIITETHGSTPLKSGAKMIVYNDGKICGTIGGGNLEKSVIENARDVIKSGKPRNYLHNLIQDHQMCCGGKVLIYIEPVINANKLFIFGAGHIGREVLRIAESLNFDVSLFDERKELLDSIKNTKISIYPFHHNEILPQLSFDNNTFIFIGTHLHQYDREILAYCIKKPFLYLGMIGSRRKTEVTKKMFLEMNIANMQEIERVDMPAGFDIKAKTPAEIAVSIIAKMIEVKNRGSLIHEHNLKESLRYDNLSKEKINAEEDSDSYRCR